MTFLKKKKKGLLNGTSLWAWITSLGQLKSGQIQYWYITNRWYCIDKLATYKLTQKLIGLCIADLEVRLHHLARSSLSFLFFILFVDDPFNSLCTHCFLKILIFVFGLVDWILKRAGYCIWHLSINSFYYCKWWYIWCLKYFTYEYILSKILGVNSHSFKNYYKSNLIFFFLLK